jgi:hypothetical protein
VSAENAGHIARMMDQCCDAIGQGGPAGICNYLCANFAELKKQRSAPNRGTQEASFPWWKIVAAAAIVGWTAYGIYMLTELGAPWWNYALVVLAMAVMTIFVAMGCGQ